MGLKYQDGSLVFGETNFVSLEKIAQKKSDPFYVYDLDGMKSRLHYLKKSFPGISPHYAMKANSADRILKMFAQEGSGVDVVSGGEIRHALKTGFKAKDIIFSGVGKSRTELELAIGEEIKQINVESPQELLRIIAMSKAMNKKPKVAFRINPDVDAKTHPYITTGFRENKFGMGEHFVPELRAILTSNPNTVDLCGLTLHIGSQLQDILPIKDAIQKTLPLFYQFKQEGHQMRTFDVGGGLGIPYNEEHTFPSKDYALLNGYGKMLQEALQGFTGEVLCEPGRILVGSCGVLVGEVQYIKETPFRSFLIVNTGIHHMMRPALYQAYHRILPVRSNDNREQRIYDIVGPICESSDVLGRERTLYEIKPGEHIAIADSGAYGYSMASYYNEHDFPEQFFWENQHLDSDKPMDLKSEKEFQVRNL
ncbi:MAG: diaminopimelate decarboxylase [Oligoflexia bacterium]|nr:diaminopimelate decarboxylase [Oligoflexia bacterium]